MNKLGSRPKAGRPWEYIFYADVEAPAASAAMVEALTELSQHATFTRVLGSYASGIKSR